MLSIKCFSYEPVFQTIQPISIISHYIYLYQHDFYNYVFTTPHVPILLKLNLMERTQLVIGHISSDPRRGCYTPVYLHSGQFVSVPGTPCRLETLVPASAPALTSA